MFNPMTWARHSLPQATSQHQLADELGISQQYIHRMEEGLSNTPPTALCDYFDQFISPEDRQGYLSDLVQKIQTYTTLIISDRYLYGKPAYKGARMADVWHLWCLYERAILPDLTSFLRRYESNDFNATARDTIKAMSEFLLAIQGRVAHGDEISEDHVNKPIYTLAKFLCINPYIIQRWDRLSKAVPPTLVLAINQTGRTKPGFINENTDLQ